MAHLEKDMNRILFQPRFRHGKPQSQREISIACAFAHHRERAETDLGDGEERRDDLFEHTHSIMYNHIWREMVGERIRGIRERGAGSEEGREKPS